ncbi:hypothetical protein A9G00_10295 [Achromobacter xylosoxidans]|nr:hypothetical protein A9G00_10295 [Achromobacter xylosoxidans]
MSISSLQARAQQLLQKVFSTPSPSRPVIDAWHVLSLVRAMWRWMVRPMLWVIFSFPFKFTWWLMQLSAATPAHQRREQEYRDRYYR